MIDIVLLIYPRADFEERAILSLRLLFFVYYMLEADQSNKIGGDDISPGAALAFLLTSSST